MVDLRRRILIARAKHDKSRLPVDFHWDDEESVVDRWRQDGKRLAVAKFRVELDGTTSPPVRLDQVSMKPRENSALRDVERVVAAATVCRPYPAACSSPPKGRSTESNAWSRRPFLILVPECGQPLKGGTYAGRKARSMRAAMCHTVGSSNCPGRDTICRSSCGRASRTPAKSRGRPNSGH
jgi:hypothetical protein